MDMTSNLAEMQNQQDNGMKISVNMPKCITIRDNAMLHTSCKFGGSIRNYHWLNLFMGSSGINYVLNEYEAFGQYDPYEI